MEFVNTDSIIIPEGLNENSKLQETVEKLFKAKNRNLIIRVPVTEMKNVNSENVWIIEFDGVLGAIRFERSGVEYPNQMKQFVGQEIYVKIVHIKQTEKGVIVTADRKVAVEEMTKLVINRIEEGQMIRSVVKGIADNALHVDIGGGCIISIGRNEVTLSNARKSLKRYFIIGETVNVKVTELDRSKNLVKVSHTATLVDPWKKYKFNKGDVVMSEIVNVVHGKDNLKVYAEIKPGLDALLIYNFPVTPKIGDKVQGEVLKFIPEQKRLRVIAKKIF